VVTALRQGGFALVEVIVALMVLATAALGVAATMTWAASQMRAAEADEALVSAAESTLDSLLSLPSPTAGARQLTSGTVRWSAKRSGRVLTLQLNLRSATSSRARDVQLRMTRIDPPPIVSAP
jgi:prepilin-type N-terminal cleavage/methylation domain-containing protein